MHEVKDKTVYYLVDRNEGKTYYIGNFNELIADLAQRIHFESRKSFKTSHHDRRDMAYDNWDFSGSDTHWIVESKLTYGRYFDFMANRFFTGWYFKKRQVLVARPYMIVNDCGNVVDFRQWEEIIAEARKNRTYYKWGTTEDAKYGDKFHRYRYSTATFIFRCGPVPGIHRCGGCGSRPHKGILNTIRNADSIRPKARIDVDYWDNYAHIDDSWKTNTKCRYQWQKNLRDKHGKKD